MVKVGQGWNLLEDLNSSTGLLKVYSFYSDVENG